MNLNEGLLKNIKVFEFKKKKKKIVNGYENIWCQVKIVKECKNMWIWIKCYHGVQ